MVAKTVTPRKTYRMMFKFWLDGMKQDEAELAAYVEFLKSERSFSRTIRNGLALMRDLRQGKTELLFTLFPDLAKQLQPVPDAPPEPEKEVEKSEPVNLSYDIRDHLERLEALLVSQRESQTAGEPPQLPAPSTRTKKTPDDQIDFEITQATSTENAAYNMMISMAGLNGRLGDLPREVIEYGIERGKLPEKARRYLKAKTPPPAKKSPPKPSKTAAPKSSKTATPKPAESPQKGPKKMDVPQLAPPSVDDLALDIGLD